VIADKILRPTGKVGELRGGHVDTHSLVERGEYVAEMDGSRLRSAEEIAGGNQGEEQRRGDNENEVASEDSPRRLATRRSWIGGASSVASAFSFCRAVGRFGEAKGRYVARPIVLCTSIAEAPRDLILRESC
jgi:hypothetical protein